MLTVMATTASMTGTAMTTRLAGKTILLIAGTAGLLVLLITGTARVMAGTARHGVSGFVE